MLFLEYQESLLFVSEFWVNINNSLVLLFRKLVVVGREKDHVQGQLIKRVHFQDILKLAYTHEACALTDILPVCILYFIISPAEIKPHHLKIMQSTVKPHIHRQRHIP